MHVSSLVDELNYSRLWRRQYLSGAAKRRQKRQRFEIEVKKRRTLEELGWSVESGKGEDANVDEPVQPSVSGSSESETTSELQCESATFVAQEGSTDSDCLCCMSM